MQTLSDAFQLWYDVSIPYICRILCRLSNAQKNRIYENQKKMRCTKIIYQSFRIADVQRPSAGSQT